MSNSQDKLKKLMKCSAPKHEKASSFIRKVNKEFSGKMDQEESFNRIRKKFALLKDFYGS